MTKKLLRGTNENLEKYAVEPILRWLIDVAQRNDALTYGEAKRRLETFHGFATVFPTRIGLPTGTMMSRIWEQVNDAPPLNMLMVRADDGLPGDGATSFLRTHTKNQRLKRLSKSGDINPAWQKALEESIAEVRAYQRWPEVYKALFKKEYKPDASVTDAAEKDGQHGGRGGGEGENHRRLRLWVFNNPGKVKGGYKKAHTETELELASGDRVDVAYSIDGWTLGIEVKSRDSNFADLRRGIFQCVKYRAVLEAQEHSTGGEVEVLLVTETKLPPELAKLAARLEVPTKQVTID
jgi:hypothetical protein